MPKTKEELMQLKKEYDTLNSKLKELSEEELKLVIGGSRRENTVVIPLQLPTSIGNSLKLDIYIDGILEESLCRTVDPIIEIINLSFKGITGYSSVTVKINGMPYKNYSINFDDSSYKEL